jgi:hypothetical protein
MGKGGGFADKKTVEGGEGGGATAQDGEAGVKSDEVEEVGGEVLAALAIGEGGRGGAARVTADDVAEVDGAEGRDAGRVEVEGGERGAGGSGVAEAFVVIEEAGVLT